MEKKPEIFVGKRNPNEVAHPLAEIPMPAEVHKMSEGERDALAAIISTAVQFLLGILFRKK